MWICLYRGGGGYFSFVCNILVVFGFLWERKGSERIGLGKVGSGVDSFRKGVVGYGVGLLRKLWVWYGFVYERLGSVWLQ